MTMKKTLKQMKSASLKIAITFTAGTICFESMILMGLRPNHHRKIHLIIFKKLRVNLEMNDPTFGYLIWNA